MVKTAIVGLYVGPREVHAVVRRGGLRVWQATAPVPDDASGLRLALDELLARIPRRRFGRVRVRAAIGLFAAQFKQLHGLPPDATPESALAAVEAQHTAHFLQNEKLVRVAGVHREPAGWFGAALDESVVDSVADACRAANIRLDGCLPAIAAASLAALDRAEQPPTVPSVAVVGIREGQRRLSMVLRDGGVAELEAAFVPEVTAGPAGSAIPPIEVADAVARMLGPSPYLLDPGARSMLRQQGRRRRMALVVLAIFAVTVAAGSPWLRASLELRSHASHRAALEVTAAPARRDAIELQHLTSGLEAVAAFDASRQSAVVLLSRLAVHLPDSTAIVSLRLNEDGANLVTLSRLGIDLLAALEGMKGFEAPQLVGAVTRESSGAHDVQRTGVMLRRSGDASYAARTKVRSP